MSWTTDVSDVRGSIDAHDVELGSGVVIEEGVVIAGIDGPADRVVIGDHSFIGRDTTIRVPSLEIGDYVTLHNHGLVSGYELVSIGHNGWIGQNCILNSTAQLTIGDNCGIGAYSQLWTHILYGDVMEGNRFDAASPMSIGKDVWFVGHCIVSPIVAGDKSMAMVGSVITRDMKANHVYGGSPASDLTEKLGPPFAEVSDESKLDYFLERRQLFLSKNARVDPAAIGVAVAGVSVIDGATMFDVHDRTYDKNNTDAEVAFMRFLLPRAKFTPR